MNELKVIFHVDELTKWKLTLANVKNFIKSSNNSEIIILANSEAVLKYSKKNYSEEIIGLIDEGIIFEACGNSLKSNNLSKINLIENINIVPSGVVELAIRQDEGFRYIKP